MSFVSIQWSTSKTLKNYLQEVSHCELAGAQEVQLDFKIHQSDVFSEIEKFLKEKNILWSLRIEAPGFTESLLSAIDPNVVLNIHFTNSAQLTEILKYSANRRPRYVVFGKKDSDFLQIPLVVPDHKRLYFAFAISDQADSLGVGEIHSLLKKIEKKFPELEIKRFPFFDPVHSSLPIESTEAFHLSPTIENIADDSKPEFSIIIPTFNSKQFLAQVLAKIHLLDFPSDQFEVLVIDDGGEDQSDQVIHQHLLTNKNPVNIRYFYWPKPQGLFRAGQCRNLGAMQARGKYLVFLDSDILLPSDFLNDLKDQMKRHDVVQYARTHLHTVTKEQFIDDPAYWQPFFESKDWMSMPFFWKYTCSYCLALTKKNFYRAGQFHRSFLSYGYEDTDLGYRLANLGMKFYISQTSVIHLFNGDSSNLARVKASLKRHWSLAKTAKIFFVLTLDPKVYHHFFLYMLEEKRPLSSILRYLKFWLKKRLLRE